MSHTTKRQLLEEVSHLRRRVVELESEKRDITEPDPAERTAQNREEQLDSLLSNVNAIILEGDPFNIYYVGGQVEKILGYPKEMWFEHPEGVVGFWSGLLHPDDADSFRLCREAIERGEDHSFEYRLIARNGEPIWFYDSVMVETRDGKPVRAWSMMIDITERKRMEDELRLNQFAIDHSAAPVAWIGEDGRFCYVNHAAYQTLGYSRDELLSMIVPEIDPGFSPESWPEHWLRMREAGSMSFESHHRTKDGREFPVEITANHVEFGNQEYVWAYVRDITQRKEAEARARRLETELAHASRLSSMGAMVSGLAHELNQPLSAVSAYAAGCKRLLEDGDDNRLIETLDKVVEQVDRAGRIIHRVQSFVRKEPPHVSTVDTNSLIRDTIGFFDEELKLIEIAISIELSDTVPPVRADPIQVQQVIVNLVRNAIDAMNEIDAHVRTLTIQSSLAEDDTVMITVHDTGAGIEAEVAKHLFDPFFTTKSNGMGLGLSVSRSIVHAHGGRMWVTPDPERGTTFHFTLPSEQGALK